MPMMRMGSARLLEQAGAKVFDARATLIDANTIDVGGQRFTAERIVIAVGGHPLRPDMPGCELGIVSDDALWLRADDGNRPDYEARGIKPFQPMGKNGPIPGQLQEVIGFDGRES